jgi:hypothetical protein
MTDADERSEAARSAARARWQDTALSRAVATVIERRDRLDTQQRTALVWAATEREDTDD